MKDTAGQPLGALFGAVCENRLQVRKGANLRCPAYAAFPCWAAVIANADTSIGGFLLCPISENVFISRSHLECNSSSGL